MDIGPRAFHTSVLIGKSLLVFGGTDILTGSRHSLLPVNISTETWEVIPLQTDLLAPEAVISAHSMLKTAANACIGIGGYRCESGAAGESPVDEIFCCQFNLSEGLVDSFLTFQLRTPNSGPEMKKNATCALQGRGNI